MKRPRFLIRLPLLTALLVCLLSAHAFASGRTQAQQQQSAPKELYAAAKRHYESGAYRQALDVLEELLKADASYAPAHLLKYRAYVGLFAKVPPLSPDERKSADTRRERKIEQAKLLTEAAKSLEEYLRLDPGVLGVEWLREQLDALRVYAEPASKPESEWTILSPSEVDEKAHILSRPQPRYPEELRGVRASGNVKLLLVLADDRAVKHILVLKSPNNAFTAAAMEAARKISFEPAIKDGHPVSTAVWVEYNFLTF